VKDKLLQVQEAGTKSGGQAAEAVLVEYESLKQELAKVESDRESLVSKHQ